MFQMENAENKFEIEKLRNIIVEYKIPMSFDLHNCIKAGDEAAYSRATEYNY